MYAKINGYDIFFDVAGLQFVPDGPVMREKPVCFVMHGGPGGDHAHFLPDILNLSEIMQLIFVDDRNCGRSSRIDPTTNSMKTNVEDIEALREYLGLDKVFILGQSYGGMKAQYYAIHHPEHLYGAIICATSPTTEGFSTEHVAKHVKEWGTPEQYDLWIRDVLGTGEMSAEEYLAIMGPLYHGPGKFDLKSTVDGQMRITWNNDVVNYQWAKGDIRNMDMREELKTVKLPCLVISGRYDFICDEPANREIAEAIPGCEYHVCEEASHEIFADCPDEVYGVVDAFVKKHFKK